MSVIEKAIHQINVNAVSQCCPDGRGVDSRIRLIVVVAYILAVLSIPMADPASLLWMSIFPIVMSEASGIGYARIFIRSLWILPLLVVIGVFNPIIDRDVVWHVADISITHGCLTFAALVLRGLLSFQALLLLISECGFFDICRCLQFFRCPKVLVTQLLVLYRYIGVLLAETLNMQRARQSRGFGKKSYPLKMWGVFAGQLLMRSIHRAKRVDNAMKARCFSGVFHFAPFASSPSAKDYAYMVFWIAVFAIIRFVNLTAIAANFIMEKI